MDSSKSQNYRNFATPEVAKYSIYSQRLNEMSADYDGSPSHHRDINMWSHVLNKLSIRNSLSDSDTVHTIYYIVYSI